MVVVINGVYIPDMILKLKNINVMFIQSSKHYFFGFDVAASVSPSALGKQRSSRTHKTAFINLPGFSSTKCYRM